MSSLDENKGMYVLVFEITGDVRVGVGALGEFDLEAGLYAYVGSARQYLRQRVERHMRREKPTRWHIDYLTTCEASQPRRALLFGQDEVTECGLSQQLGDFEQVSAPIEGFGASDCDAGCRAHLWRVHDPTIFERIDPGRVMVAPD
jgi:Uri superfamily endonuclease